ncbi:MAG TPA: hypothetical protein VGY31_04335 [Terriglobia bacterium]|nr:hypothetical protein [Terriglobia bacterium]
MLRAPFAAASNSIILDGRGRVSSKIDLEVAFVGADLFANPIAILSVAKNLLFRGQPEADPSLRLG